MVLKKNWRSIGTVLSELGAREGDVGQYQRGFIVATGTGLGQTRCLDGHYLTLQLHFKVGVPYLSNPKPPFRIKSRSNKKAGLA